MRLAPDRPGSERCMTSPPPASSGISDHRRGVLWMLLAMFLFTGMDACAKTLIQTYPVVQVVWARYFFHVLILAVVLAPRLRGLMRTERLGLQLMRSLLLLLTTGLFFSGLQFVPLANASAIMLASPIVVTALAIPLLKERVGPRRWMGVMAGCLGAAVIIRPGSEFMQLASLFTLGAACTYALYQISTRFLSQSDPVLTTLLYSASIGALVTSAVVPFFWVTPAPADWLLFILLGLLGGIGHFAMIKSLTVAPAAVVVPFTYSNMIWATLYGFILFAELPDMWTVAGAVIIAGSGLYIFHREQRQDPGVQSQ